MSQFGKALIFIGIVIVFAGLIVWMLGRLGFRGLPGDIRYETDGVRIYFPIVTLLVLSIALTILINVALWIWRWFNQ